MQASSQSDPNVQRLQTAEMFQDFDQFGLDVIKESSYDEAIYGTFDLCPPEQRSSAMSSKSLAMAQKYV